MQNPFVLPAEAKMIESNKMKGEAYDIISEATSIDKIGASNDSAEQLYFIKELTNPEYCLKYVCLRLFDPNKTYAKIQDAVSKVGDLLKSDDVNKLVNSSDSGDDNSNSASNGIRDAFNNTISSAKQAIDDANIFLSQTPDYEIYLPLMNALQESNQHEYSSDSGLFGEVANAVNSLTSSASKATLQIGAAIGGKQSASYTPQLPLMDPLKWQNYNGSKLRTFSFVFRLSPRNKEEALSMLRIVYILKKYSYPKQNDAISIILLPPSRVQVIFSNPVLQKLINPEICVISDINVVYESGNDIATTLDGVPKKIEVTIVLNEFRQKYFNDFDKNTGGDIV